MQTRPEYLLFTEALRHASGRLMWRFLLLKAGSDETVTASDLVDETSSARTELLAVVRGLEALDGPASVRLFTGSGYVSRGLERGLAQWRTQAWHWERFGRRVPVRNCDLWQRIDHALSFHTVECRAWGEASHTSSELAYEVAEEMHDSTAPSPALVDESAVLVVPKRRLSTKTRSRRPSRLAAATRNTIGKVRSGVGSLLEPALVPAG